MKIAALGATAPGVTHHEIMTSGAKLHYVSSGESGSPILLIHGFTETWWVFHKLIPLLAIKHRVFALDMRGFGDSDQVPDNYGSEAHAKDLHDLISALGVGPVHLVGQDISGAVVYRLAVTHPKDVLSLTVIEAGLPGFGLEAFADFTHGGAWYIGFLAVPGVAEMLLRGREREFLTNIAFPTMCAVPDAVTTSDMNELVRSYSRPNAWKGPRGLYEAMLKDGPEIRARAEAHKLTTPVLAIGAGGGEFTSRTMNQVAASKVHSIHLDGVGHYAAMEAPERVAGAVLDFITGLG
jgi:pimeloyl-ACP methyl ester carboxylesterase